MSALLAAFLPLAACAGDMNEEAASACEVYIKGKLRSPSTYKRVSVAFDHELQLFDGNRGKKVYISYDAANAFGTPVRSSEACAFEVDNDGTWAGGMDTDAVLASTRELIGDSTGCCMMSATRGGQVLSKPVVSGEN